MVGAGLIGSSGLMAYISPKTTVAAYKVSAEFVDANALCGVRSLGAWQMALAALLLIPTVDVHSISHYLAAAAILISIPAWEAWGALKEPMVIWIGILTALGKLDGDGKVPAWVAPVLYLANGAQCHFTPEGTTKLYKVAKPPTGLGLAAIGNQGGTMLVAGAYLASLSAGLTQSQAYGLAWIVQGLIVTKWAFVEADKFAQPKAPLLAWLVISAALAGLYLAK